MFRSIRLSLLAITLAATIAASAQDNDNLVRLREGKYAGAPPPANSLRLVNWNIARGVELPEITKFLEKSQADIAVLQEVDLNARRSGSKDVADTLAKTLRLNYAFGPAFRELTQMKKGVEEEAIQGQATLARVPITNSRNIKFAAQSTFWEPKKYLPSWALFQRRNGGRTALVTELDVHGRRVVVYNVHLESRSGEIQEKQLGETLTDTARYPAETPLILVGDFNSKYHPKVMLQRLQKAGWTSCFGDQVVRTHHIIGWVDWVFVRGPVTCEEAVVQREAKGSDHFPIAVKLVWR